MIGQHANLQEGGMFALPGMLLAWLLFAWWWDLISGLSTSYYIIGPGAPAVCLDRLSLLAHQP